MYCMSLSTNEQLISFHDCFGFLSRLYQDRVKNVIPSCRFLHGEHNMVSHYKVPASCGLRPCARESCVTSCTSNHTVITHVILCT